jgi:Tol biopolymer transport system component
MKQSRKASALLAAVLVLVILLLFANRNLTRQSPQTAEGTGNPVTSPSPAVSPLPSAIVVTSTPLPPDFPTHVALTLAAMPTIPPTATSTLQPPQCTFPLAQTTDAESTPQNYTFSEPQVVLTSPQGNYYGVAEWLPDNQQVLITEALRNNFVPQNDNYPQQSISLYNPETGEMKLYAIRTETGGTPSWEPDLNAVVYPVANFYQLDRKNHIAKFTRQIWVSYGNPDTAQMLDDNLLQFSIAIKPDGSEIIYLSDKKISKLDKSLKELPPIPIDPTQWDYASERRDNQPVSYNMAWQPGTDLVFLYSDGATKGGGYTFILNANTGQICELNLGGWAAKAHWSSDGRYLAFVRATEYFFPLKATDLTLLDTTMGNLITLVVTPQEMEGRHYVDDFVWAPDNCHLLAIGSVSLFKNNEHENGLYLVDFMSGQSAHVASEYKSSLSPQDDNLAWSPDGSKLLIRCPLDAADQICLISVQRTGQ